MNVCADAGYGSLENYSYLNKNDIGNYVKHQTWEGNSSGRYPECYKLLDDNTTICCLNGNIAKQIKILGRHPKKANAQFYRIDGCCSCSF